MLVQKKLFEELALFWWIYMNYLKHLQPDYMAATEKIFIDNLGHYHWFDDFVEFLTPYKGNRYSFKELEELWGIPATDPNYRSEIMQKHLSKFYK